jgi:hypothetical protein
MAMAVPFIYFRPGDTLSSGKRAILGVGLVGIWGSDR